MGFYAMFERLCNERGITLAKVRADLGISQSTMASWKSRGLTPKAQTIQKIADYFGVSVNYLLGWSDAKDRLYDVGLSVDDVANELSVPVKLLRDVIESNDGGSTEFMEKIIQVSTLLADITEKQTSAMVKRINAAVEQMTPEGQGRVADYAEDILPRYRLQNAPQLPPCQQVGTDTTPPPDAPETDSEGE